jgi:hypothetical protein
MVVAAWSVLFPELRTVDRFEEVDVERAADPVPTR